MPTVPTAVPAGLKDGLSRANLGQRLSCACRPLISLIFIAWEHLKAGLEIRFGAGRGLSPESFHGEVGPRCRLRSDRLQSEELFLS